MPSVYGVFAGLGCAVGVSWLRRHRQRMGLSDREFWAAMWTLLLGGVIGAKALFAILGWEHYARGELRFFADFRVGFVFFGGLAGAALAGLAFARVRGLGFVRGADYFAVALPIGHAIGRIGCFFEGCCHGRPPHPVQLYESAGLALIAASCRVILARVEAGTLPPGMAFRAYLLCYGVLRLLLDPLRGDGRPERLLGLSHQQGIALGLVAIAALWRPTPSPNRRSFGAGERGGARKLLRLGSALLLGVGLALPARPATAVDAAEARAAWARVLERHVTPSGSIDFEAIRKAPADLDTFVAWVAKVGPRSTPARFSDPASRLAYYLDGYNALAMWNVVHGRWRPVQKIRFFYLTQLELDGDAISLYSLENDVIRPLGDPRVHFALNCMVRGCPRLPREPWSPERLDAQLDAAARLFASEPRNVELLEEERVVRLSSIFDFYTADFLAQAPSLLAYVNRYRAERIPEDYEVEFIPYDWTVNQSGVTRW